MKLPSFDGKEDWKVWVSRFEAIAERRQWDDDTKLDTYYLNYKEEQGILFLPSYPNRHWSAIQKW